MHPKQLAKRPSSARLLSREHRGRPKKILIFGTLLAAAASLTMGRPTQAGDTPRAPSSASDIDPKLSLKGKTIGITVIGTNHYWDLRSYQAQIDEVKRLGGTPIALDAGRDDNRQISQIQTLLAQKPDAIIEQLGTLTVLEPWLQKIRKAGIPLFTTDTA